MTRQKSVHYLALSTVALWSSAYVFTKLALEHYTSSSLGLIRCAVATGVLAVILLGRKTPGPKAGDLPWLILSGAVGFAVYLLAFNRGSEILSPTTSCLIISTAPIISALLARICFRESLSRSGWLAMIIAFCGVMVMRLREGTLELSTGVWGLLMSALSISSYSLLQRKLALKYDPLTITGYSFAAATLLLAVFAPEAAVQLREAAAPQVVLALFLGIFPSALAYQLWSIALSRANRTSTVTNYMFLTPFLTGLLEFAVIRQAPEGRTVLGGLIIIGGLMLFAFKGEKRPVSRDNGGP